MGNPIVAIVTGANRGIGEAIAQTLAKTVQGPFILYAASRKGQDLGFEKAPQVEIRYPKLDIADSSSIKHLAQSIKQDHKALDVLINNAGVNLDDGYTPENVKITLDTNVRGTLHMCQAFIPILAEKGRIVNVSSTGSSLKLYSKEIQNRFRDPNMTLGDLEMIMREYQNCANKGSERKYGWPQQAYSVSKACINALTAVLARETPGLTINACCPGWVATDMGTMVGSMPPKSTADGAKIPIRLGFKDIGGITGRYWGNRSIADTGEGEVQEW